MRSAPASRSGEPSRPPARVALGIEYDGSAFCGWERQRHCLSVQEVVEEALAGVADRPVRVVCAGRTDAGVHALGQVVHFDTDAERPPRAWIRGTNTSLPGEVAVRWAQAVPVEFHARFSAERRRYRYLVLNRSVRSPLARRRMAWEPRPLDVEAMRAGAWWLVGRHDFSAYRASGCQARTPVREVFELAVARAGDVVSLDVAANAFLLHMVRNVAGVLLAIGRGEREPRWAKAVLDSRDRSCGGVTAPPAGLYLAAVDYPACFGLPQAAAPRCGGSLLPPPGLW